MDRFILYDTLAVKNELLPRVDKPTVASHDMVGSMKHKSAVKQLKIRGHSFGPPRLACTADSTTLRPRKRQLRPWTAPGSLGFDDSSVLQRQSTIHAIFCQDEFPDLGYLRDRSQDKSNSINNLIRQTHNRLSSLRHISSSDF
jgi:hypothetical protein